jgi:hypothetical protein
MIGCSDSTSSGPNYPLQLTTVSDTIGLGASLYNFQVTKNGTPLKGARLFQTDDPSGLSFDLGVMSDSGGHFPHVILVVSDTLSEAAFQAVSDSLTSNYIRAAP